MFIKPCFGDNWKNMHKIVFLDIFSENLIKSCFGIFLGQKMPKRTTIANKLPKMLKKMPKTLENNRSLRTWPWTFAGHKPTSFQPYSDSMHTAGEPLMISTSLDGQMLDLSLQRWARQRKNNFIAFLVWPNCTISWRSNATCPGIILRPFRNDSGFLQARCWTKTMKQMLN